MPYGTASRFTLISFVFVATAVVASMAHAAIDLPQGLSGPDRERVLQIVGLGMSSKLLTDPYPLGGYVGFEAGVSIESLPVDDIAHLGSTLTQGQSNATYPKLSIGKGLYNNIDLFFQFVPYTAQDQLSQYGGILRWGFYQAESIPLSLSAAINMSSANISDILATQSYGLDVYGGMNVSRVGIFAGLGYQQATGTFLGGRSGLLAQSDSITPVASANEFVSGMHEVVGADVKIASAIIALQIDHYTTPVYSAKVGVRF